ncbi:Ubiquinol-cytochrome C reductase complex core protein [Ceratobasidium theobromae]|uniref:Cytochrome b-c1 complex subunit 2, mitochondrial n=1 Tax=Ceratobasidium theobromae TaxID=1582974 RepID=A0A5N5QPP1_9AGAM|nr:Ubiquinol-cytochrome C reductase complex core protein [Ceratobasidium theobromae]
MLARSTRTMLRAAVRSYATVVDSAGLKVAAVDNGQPTASITLLVKAGSRYETTRGSAQLLKNFSFKVWNSTADRSSLHLAREAELYGGLLSSTLSREHLAITADFLRGDEPLFVELLSSVVTSPKFLPHELNEAVLPSTATESTIALGDPGIYALELAHAVAFRSTGLGSSLFVDHPPSNALDAVKAFAASAFTKSNIAVIGTGIDHAKLSKLVEKHLSGLAPSASSTKAGSSQYFGGETRVGAHGHGHAAFIGFGAPGGVSPDLAVLHAHLDATPALKWTHGLSPLAGTSAEPVYLEYSDAALFGVLVKGETADQVGKNAKAAVAALKKAAAGLSKEDATRAIAKAKFAAAASVEGRQGLAASVAPEVFGGPKADLQSVHAALGKVSESSVAKTLSSLIKVKPTFVAVGDIHALPYVDELGL